MQSGVIDKYNHADQHFMTNFEKYDSTDIAFLRIKYWCVIIAEYGNELCVNHKKVMRQCEILLFMV